MISWLIGWVRPHKLQNFFSVSASSILLLLLISRRMRVGYYGYSRIRPTITSHTCQNVSVSWIIAFGSLPALAVSQPPFSLRPGDAILSPLIDALCCYWRSHYCHDTEPLWEKSILSLPILLGAVTDYGESCCSCR